MPYSVLLVLFVSAVFTGAAQAASSLNVPRPPATLSPDLAEPWVVQIKPGKRAVISDPRPRTAYIAPLASLKREPAQVAKRRTFNPAFLPRTVSYFGSEAEGTIIIDTNNRFLFLVLGNGRAKRYGVGVGRPGFEWAGSHTVAAKAEWPIWTPPEEMRARQPFLPASMKGGPGNPLGARALYLGDTLYRIHGSNEPWTIGQAVSSGCIRMRNEDVIDLYERVKVGTRVVVL